MSRLAKIRADALAAARAAAHASARTVGRFVRRLAGARRLAVPIAAAVAIVLAALLGAFYVKTQAADAQRYGEALAWLRELKAIDARWDVALERTRTEFVEAAAPVPAADDATAANRLRQELTAAARDLNSPALRQGLDGLTAAFARKADLVEKFRKANAVTRKALARVLAADAEIAGLVRATWQDFRDHERLVAAESAVTQLLAEAQRYYFSAGDAPRKNVESVAADLRAAAESLPPALREGLARLDANVQQLLGAKPIEEGLAQRLALATAGPRVDSLAFALSAELDARLTARARYRAYLAAVGGALLVLAAYFLLRLATTYRRLALANDDLERRDAERARDLAAARDRRKESEAQLIQTEKLSTLGQMVAGVAHEVNTPLAYVKESLASVRGRLPGLAQVVAEADRLITMLKSGGEPAVLARQLAVLQAHIAEIEQRQALDGMRRQLQDGLHGVEQIAEIVAGLRNFARLDRGRMANFNLNEGLQSTLLIARHELRRHTVEKQLGDIPAITCSPSQINQVLLNLINNAAQSIESGRGTIRLTTRREDDAHVAVEIEDNGRGIPPDVLPRIFDPFFTTREAGMGTGLGLSISHRIIEQHGGRITVDSAVGIGTKFRVVLPLTPPPAEELAA